MPEQVDLFVIGGGSAGVRAARVAAGHGAKVALVEAYRYGGTCVIRGCVPKKPLVPARMVIVGGGFIAAEFACLLQRLGTRVTLAYRGGRILRGFDDDLRRHLCDAMAEAGIEIRNDVAVTAIRREGDGLRVEAATGAPIDADVVMLATGRRPNVDGLGLQTAGVALDERGAIRVTSDSRTSADGIWAVGDVTDRLQLTPVAIREGHAFADTVFGGRPWVCDHDTVPFAVFSTPEIGTVGLTEARARQDYANVDIYRSTFRPMGNTLSARAERMLVKLVVDRDSDRVLGVHLCGPDAAEMVQLAAIAVKMGATERQFDQTVALHPTAAEELVTMREPLPDPGR